MGKEENSLKHERARWYGDIDNLKIEAGSSGTFRVIIESRLLTHEDFRQLLEDILWLIRAEDSVETHR